MNDVNLTEDQVKDILERAQNGEITEKEAEIIIDFMDNALDTTQVFLEEIKKIQDKEKLKNND